MVSVLLVTWNSASFLNECFASLDRQDYADLEVIVVDNASSDATRELLHPREATWRVIYNHERPHEALDLRVPGSRYEASRRSFPEQLPKLEFSPIDIVRKVQRNGWFSFQGREWRISKAFQGERVGVRPTVQESVWEVWFGPQCLGEIDQHADAENWRVVRHREGS